MLQKSSRATSQRDMRINYSARVNRGVRPTWSRVFYLLMDTERISEGVVRGQLTVLFALRFTSMIYYPRDFCVRIIPSRR